MNCAYHTDREPVGACVACGKLICVECKTEISGNIYCNPCVEKMFNEGKPAATTATPTKESPKAKAKSEPAVVSTATDTTSASQPVAGSRKKQNKLVKWIVGIVIIVILLLVAIWAILTYALNYDISFTI